MLIMIRVWADFSQVIVFQVQVAHDAGAVVLNYDIGNGDEPEEEVSAALSLEVQGYAVLVAGCPCGSRSRGYGGSSVSSMPSGGSMYLTAST